MTIQRRTVLVLVLVFLFGGFIGAYLGYQAAWDLANDDEMLSIAVNARLEATALRGLREGENSGALELLEALLDSKIVSLKQSDRYSERTNNSVLESIQVARGYREKFLRKSQYPDNDAAVNRVLSAQRDGSLGQP